MKIQKLFNATEKDIESKEFNIFIGISLGNKWFTKDNLREYLRWALENTKEKVLFLIADRPQAINYNIRNKNSERYNLKRSLRNGEKVKEMIEELISELPKDKQKKVEILKWDEYESVDVLDKKYTPMVYNEFENDLEFKGEILSMIKDFIKDKEFSEKEYLELSEYLLEEFVASYSGIKIGSDYYGMYIYPQESPLHYFIEDMQDCKIFPELNKKLPKEKVALAIVN